MKELIASLIVQHQGWSCSIPWVSIASFQRFCKHLSQHCWVRNINRIKYGLRLQFLEYQLHPPNASASTFRSIVEYQILIVSLLWIDISSVLPLQRLQLLAPACNRLVECRILTRRKLVEYEISIASTTISWVLKINRVSNNLLSI